MNHRRLLTLLLVSCLLYELSLLAYMTINQEFIVVRLDEFYREFSKVNLVRTIQVTYVIDSTTTILVYGYGFSALYTHSTKQFNSLNLWLLVSIFTKVVITYFNALNVLVCILKMVLYLYSRFLLSLLYTVLVIPRDLQMSQQS